MVVVNVSSCGQCMVCWADNGDNKVGQTVYDVCFIMCVVLKVGYIEPKETHSVIYVASQMFEK